MACGAASPSRRSRCSPIRRSSSGRSRCSGSVRTARHESHRVGVPRFTRVAGTGDGSVRRPHAVSPDEWRIGRATVSANLINHPGPTVGFRIQEDDRTMAYMPDHEPALGVDDLATASPEWVSGVGVAYGVDVLFHDGQYTQDE